MSTSAVSSTWVFIMPVTTAGTSKTHRPRRARRPFGRLSGYSLVVPGGGYVGSLVVPGGGYVGGSGRAPYGDCGSSVIGPYDGGAAALGGGYWSPSAVASIGAAAVGAAACAAGAAASAAAARRSATATSRRLWTERRPSATDAKKRISAPTP